jgi:hyaluronate lyase
MNATYEYVLLPNKTAAETADYSAKSSVVILENTSNVQALRHNSLGILAANFWSAGNLESITVSGPASVIAQEGKSELRLAISDPTQRQNAIAVTVGWEKQRPPRVDHSDSSITLLETQSRFVNFVVNSKGSLGKSHFVKLV